MTSPLDNTHPAIRAAFERRAAKGLICRHGCACATPEQVAWHNARHGLSRADYEASKAHFDALHAAAIASTPRR